ncbi:hypothetical protein H706_00207 [Bartonella bacilliformis CAR600-02]|nr:hypothetical protein H706_00207 [Bartonella bacilliformis CAR600-02]
MLSCQVGDLLGYRIGACWNFRIGQVSDQDRGLCLAYQTERIFGLLGWRGLYRILGVRMLCVWDIKTEGSETLGWWGIRQKVYWIIRAEVSMLGAV